MSASLSTEGLAFNSNKNIPELLAELEAFDFSDLDIAESFSLSQVRNSAITICTSSPQKPTGKLAALDLLLEKLQIMWVEMKLDSKLRHQGLCLLTCVLHIFSHPSAADADSATSREERYATLWMAVTRPY